MEHPQASLHGFCTFASRNLRPFLIVIAPRAQGTPRKTRMGRPANSSWRAWRPWRENNSTGGKQPRAEGVIVFCSLIPNLSWERGVKSWRSLFLGSENERGAPVFGGAGMSHVASAENQPADATACEVELRSQARYEVELRNEGEICFPIQSSSLARSPRNRGPFYGFATRNRTMNCSGVMG